MEAAAEPMEVTATISTTPSAECLNITEKPCSLVNLDIVHAQRQCLGDSFHGGFPFSWNHSILLHILTSYNLDAQDLAHLEATCSFFRLPSNLDTSYPELNIVEVAAIDKCRRIVPFKLMESKEGESLKQCCGGSWKLVMEFLMAREACYNQREKFQAFAGAEHSLVVTSSGAVYSFGKNNSGQLGHGTLEDEYKPRLIRELQGIRIVQAALGIQKTMLVSDTGNVYAFGKEVNPEYVLDPEPEEVEAVMTPKPMESLKDIYVVQVSIGNYFTAVLSREGRVYTISWGHDARLGHNYDPYDKEPCLLLGPLENLPVVQIAAGNCFLLALAFQPGGLSVFSLGCGLGGKLGRGTTKNGYYPRKIEQFQTLNLKPICISAGPWHSAVLGHDGRVCTWGWSSYGCLGHGYGDGNLLTTPEVVEGLGTSKAIHIATGNCTTFVVSENGDVYSFGFDGHQNLGQQNASAWKPVLASSIKKAINDEMVVQLSTSRTSANWAAHTLLVTDAGKLYAFGSGDCGQLGLEFNGSPKKKLSPELVKIDLS